MEIPLSIKPGHDSTRLARRTSSLRFLEYFFWYINIPIAHLCWVITMIDENGGLMGVRMENFWRTFKMPSLGLSLIYYVLSMFVFPLLASWLVRR